MLYQLSYPVTEAGNARGARGFGSARTGKCTRCARAQATTFAILDVRRAFLRIARDWRERSAFMVPDGRAPNRSEATESDRTRTGDPDLAPCGRWSRSSEQRTMLRATRISLRGQRVALRALARQVPAKQTEDPSSRLPLRRREGSFLLRFSLPGCDLSGAVVFALLLMAHLPGKGHRTAADFRGAACDE